jgi:regulatory protein
VRDADQRLQHALELAYRYLGRRDRTVCEVRRHLERKRVDRSTIGGALETLTVYGYLDDARFARVFAEDKGGLEHWGCDRIRRGLLERGVERELIDSTLDLQAPGTELGRALGLLRRRFPSAPQGDRERDRALGVLLRKGYDADLAADALAAYVRDAGERELR